MNKILIIISIIIFIISCSTTEKTKWERNTTSEIGEYPPLPPNYVKPTLGVLEFKDETGMRRGASAADEITTLWIKSKRFKVIERTRLKEILKEQEIAGKVGKIKSCQYLCLGSITNFEIKRVRSQGGGGILRNLGRVVHVPVGEINWSKEKLYIHIGVDVRIVDTTTGEIILDKNADVKRTETAKELGLALAGIDFTKQGKIELDNKNQGRLLRLALDEVVRKMIPELDKMFTK